MLPNGEDRPRSVVGVKWPRGSAGRALGGLVVGAAVGATVHQMRRSRFWAAPVPTPVPQPRSAKTSRKVTVAWAVHGTLFQHPNALMNAATAAVANDVDVVFREERTDDDPLRQCAQSAPVDPPRVLFFRMGERISTSDRLSIKKFFDRRSSRCLVVLMLNGDKDCSSDHNDGGLCVLPWLSAATLRDDNDVASIHTRTSNVPIECAYAYFEEETLHPFEGESAVNKRAVDAIVSLVRGPSTEPSRFGGRML